VIVFKTIKWRNFLSTGNQWTTLDLDKTKLTLIVGQNGAGKSTLLDALTFSLYGKTFRNINKPLLINSINKKDTLVEVTFTVNGNEFLVRRGMKPNVFDIIKNGEQLNKEANMVDFQEYLEKHILKLNYKSFCQVVILGSTSFVPFMQLPTGARREVIEDLLDLEIFTTMNSLLKTKMQETDSGLTSIRQKETLLKEKMQFHESLLEDMNKDNDILIKEVEHKIKDHHDRLIVEKSKVEENSKQFVELNAKLSSFSSVQEKFESMKDIKSKLDNKISNIKKEVLFFSKYDNCPTCKQQIDGEFKSTYVNEKTILLTESENGMEKLLAQLNKLQQNINKMSEVHAELSKLSIQNAGLQASINNIEKTIQSLHKDKVKLTDKKQTIIDSSVLKDLEKEQETIYENKKTLLNDKELQQVTQTMLKDSGIKSVIIKQYIPVINKLINRYLASMDFFCNFTLDETFTETIKSRYRDDFSYHSFSEGEKRRIDLAILFAWRAVAKMRNSASTNLLIFDEVLDGSTDQSGIESFFTIIKEVIQNTNVIVISHTQSSHESKFDRTLRFKKEKNFSVMME
jgi:DNA repair exonuclease SbcCD ATPase subunit